MTAAADPGLHLGDCRDVLARLPDASIDLLLTDPPYGINYVSPARTLPFEPMANDDGDEAFEVLDGALAAAEPKLKPDSHVYIFSCWKTYRAMAEVVRRYFALANVLIWVKNNWGVGDLEGAYGEQQELIIFAQKGAAAPQRSAAEQRAALRPRGHEPDGASDAEARRPVGVPHRKIQLPPRVGGGPVHGRAQAPASPRGAPVADTWASRYTEQWYDVALRRLADPNEEG